MRLAVCALSAVLLSGCSWLGGLGNLGGNYNGANFGKSAQLGGYTGHQQNPCVVFSPQAPIPHGCDPASVTIGSASGGFPQQPNFGGGNFTSGGYGTHAGVAGQQAANYQPRQSLRKPKFRGSLSIGAEKSISGNFLDFNQFSSVDPSSNYNPAAFNEGFITGSQPAGEIVETTFTALIENINNPNISFNDVYSTPLSLKGGVEYIHTPNTTFFANAGYGYSEGKSSNAVSITGELQREVQTDTYITIPAVVGVPAIEAVDAVLGTPEIPATEFTPAIPAVPGIPGVAGQDAIAAVPESYEFVDSITTVGFIPNQNIANYEFDFSSQERLELELGARHYFNPIVRDQGYRTITPFVGASIGATHHNAVSFTVSQNQRFYQRAFDSGGETADYYQVPIQTTRVDLYDSQWVPTGQLNAGVEWQVTPKTALAFESGLKFEGARDYSNGESGDDNIAIPVTVRGSYNF